MEKYTHRNGERETPLVNGWYWVEGAGNWWFVHEFEDGHWLWRQAPYLPKGMPCYGPIPEPQGEE